MDHHAVRQCDAVTDRELFRTPLEHAVEANKDIAPNLELTALGAKKDGSRPDLDPVPHHHKIRVDVFRHVHV